MLKELSLQVFEAPEELKLWTHNSLITSYMFADVAKNISAS